MSISKKLRSLSVRSYQTKLSSVIFGELSALAKFRQKSPSLRIACLPFVSESQPYEALILSICLKHLLAKHTDIHAYGIWFLPNEQKADWQISDSQFGLNQWTDKELLENVVVSGLLHAKSEYKLTLHVSGALDANVITAFEFSGANFASLMNQLPRIAQTIADHFKLEDVELPEFEVFQVNDTAEIAKLVDWEVLLLRNLEDITWNEEVVAEQSIALCELAGQYEKTILEWAIYQSVLSVLSGMYELDSATVSSVLQAVRNQESYWSVLSLSDRLYRGGRVAEAIELLKGRLEIAPDEIDVTLQLTQFLTLNFQLEDAASAYQASIVSNHVSYELYVNYAEVLAMLEQYQININQYVLTNETENPLISECIASMQQALNLKENSVLRYKLMEYLRDTENVAFVPALITLITTDLDGVISRDALDMVMDTEFVDETIEALQTLTQKSPQKALYWLLLGHLYVLVDDLDNATDALQEASTCSDIDTYILIHEQLTVRMEFPDYEFEMMEIGGVLDAKNKVSSDQIDFLESVVQMAPHYADAYLLLAQCYVSWDDPEATIEVLLDAYKAFPDNAEIILQLTTVLWDDEQTDTALEYILQGIEQMPTEASLVARLAKYLFDGGQNEDAKATLLKAEALDPANQELQATKRHIGKTLASESD